MSSLLPWKRRQQQHQLLLEGLAAAAAVAVYGTWLTSTQSCKILRASSGMQRLPGTTYRGG
jgi:hypothetical protein